MSARPLVALRRRSRTAGASAVGARTSKVTRSAYSASKATPSLSHTERTVPESS